MTITDLEKKDRVIEFEVANWEKYNPRKDIKSPQWFRLSNRLLEDEDFYDLTDAEIRAWIYILSLCSQKNSKLVKVSLKHAFIKARVDPASCIALISKLMKLGIILKQSTLRARNVPVQNLCATLQDKTEHNKTGQDNKSCGERGLSPSSSAAVLPELSGLKSVIEERRITEREQKAWLEAFPDANWISSEVRKALAWEASNPQRRKKNFGSFMTKWMTRGWDSRRLTTHSKTATSLDELFGEKLDDAV